MDPAHRALVEFRQFNSAEFQLAERFPLIIACFSTVFELGGPAPRLATYKRCREHVAEDGILALDNSFQGSGEQAFWGKNRPDGLLEFCNSFQHPKDPGIFVQHFEAQHYSPDGGMKMTIFLDAISTANDLSRRCFEVTRYYASPEQTEAELREAGFTESNFTAALSGNGSSIRVCRAEADRCLSHGRSRASRHCFEYLQNLRLEALESLLLTPCHEPVMSSLHFPGVAVLPSRLSSGRKKDP